MPKVLDFIRMVYRGKTLRRIVFNWKLEEWGKEFHGVVVDFGAGNSESLKKWLPKDATYIPTDFKEVAGVKKVDLNEKLPFANDTVDVATIFFSLYILENPEASLREIRRVLKPGGKLYVATPLIAPEIPEPHDFERFTHEGLTRLFMKVGFTNINIERSGGRFSSAVILLHPVFVFKTIRLFVFLLALLLDACTRHKDTINPAPHTYFCVVKK